MRTVHLLRASRPFRPLSEVTQGLEVSLHDILKNLLAQRQLRNQPLQLGVLLLELFESLGLVQLRPAELLTWHVQLLCRVLLLYSRWTCLVRLCQMCWGANPSVTATHVP